MRARFVSILRGCAIGLLTASLLAGARVDARAGAANEYEIKAALIYNITRAFEWPEARREDSAVRIGILGDDPFGDALVNVFRNKRAPFGDHFEVVSLSTLEDARQCHLVFVARQPSDAILAMLPPLREASVLIIGEEPRFAEQQGGILALVPDGRSLAMVLNLSALADGELQAKSKFMRLCRIVGDAAR